MRTLLERAMEKVDKNGPGGCWLWTASLGTGGYGQISITRGKPGRAHRVVYELLRTPIPEGLQLDHLCRVRHCVNPDHLEPVTNRENTIRGDAPRMARERALSMTHCKSGHPLAGDNARRTAAGERVCRACARAKSRKHFGERPKSRARGPMRRVVEHNGRRSLLSCGHVRLRDSGNRPAQMRCPDCEPPADQP